MNRDITMRVAIVHHWFVTIGGGERVAETLAKLFPTADIFTLVASKDGLPSSFTGRVIHKSLLQKIPGGNRFHRHLLALYPFAVEQLDLTSYDLVISSDSGPMKGVITHPRAIHICYCHSPMRYLWDGYHAYAASMPAVTRIPFSLAAHYVRNWDYMAAQRVDYFIANSEYVRSRIKHYYRRDSTVIHPPVETTRGYIVKETDSFYLAAGRLVGYKKTDLMIEACNRLGRRLRVAGVGPEYKRLKRMAGPTIEFTGKLSDNDLWESYARCRALLFAAEEDFGIVPLEAQACGRPVIAFSKGGALETVVDHRKRGDRAPATGVFFDEQSADSLCAAILEFERNEADFSPIEIRRHSMQFDSARFAERILEFVAAKMPINASQAEGIEDSGMRDVLHS